MFPKNVESTNGSTPKNALDTPSSSPSPSASVSSSALPSPSPSPSPRRKSSQFQSPRSRVPPISAAVAARKKNNPAAVEEERARGLQWEFTLKHIGLLGVLAWIT